MDNRVLVIRDRVNHLDFTLCQAINGLLRHVPVHRFFSGVSRLGDGVIWYVIILSLPVLVTGHGVALALILTLIGLLNLFVYKKIKTTLARPRPFAAYPTIVKGTHVLDEYSFPSGHTLHAVTFTMMLSVYNPLTAIFLVPFAVLTAMSRVVLGVHFPSDVLVGAFIGLLHGWLGIFLMQVFGVI